MSIGINLATERLKETLISEINKAKLPVCCIRLACRDVMDAVEKEYTEAVKKEMADTYPTIKKEGEE